MAFQEFMLVRGGGVMGKFTQKRVCVQAGTLEVYDDNSDNDEPSSAARLADIVDLVHDEMRGECSVVLHGGQKIRVRSENPEVLESFMDELQQQLQAEDDVFSDPDFSRPDFRAELDDANTGIGVVPVHERLYADSLVKQHTLQQRRQRQVEEEDQHIRKSMAEWNEIKRQHAKDGRDIFERSLDFMKERERRNRERRMVLQEEEEQKVQASRMLPTRDWDSGIDRERAFQRLQDDAQERIKDTELKKYVRPMKWAERDRLKKELARKAEERAERERKRAEKLKKLYDKRRDEVVKNKQIPTVKKLYADAAGDLDKLATATRSSVEKLKAKPPADADDFARRLLNGQYVEQRCNTKIAEWEIRDQLNMGLREAQAEDPEAALNKKIDEARKRREEHEARVVFEPAHAAKVERMKKRREEFQRKKETLEKENRAKEKYKMAVREEEAKKAKEEDKQRIKHKCELLERQQDELDKKRQEEHAAREEMIKKDKQIREAGREAEEAMAIYRQVPTCGRKSQVAIMAANKEKPREALQKEADEKDQKYNEERQKREAQQRELRDRLYVPRDRKWVPPQAGVSSPMRAQSPRCAQSPRHARSPRPAAALAPPTSPVEAALLKKLCERIEVRTGVNPLEGEAGVRSPTRAQSPRRAQSRSRAQSPGQKSLYAAALLKRQREELEVRTGVNPLEGEVDVLTAAIETKADGKADDGKADGLEGPALRRAVELSLKKMRDIFGEAEKESRSDGYDDLCRLPHYRLFKGILQPEGKEGNHKRTVPDPICQQIEGLDGLLQAAEAAQEILMRTLQEDWPEGEKLAMPTNMPSVTFAYNPGIMSRAEAETKALVLHGPTEVSSLRYRHLLDLARLTLVFPSSVTLKSGLDAILQQFEVVRVQNFFRDPTPLGRRFVEVLVLVDLSKDPSTVLPYVCRLQLETLPYNKASTEADAIMQGLCAQLCLSDVAKCIATDILTAPEHKLARDCRRKFEMLFGSTLAGWRQAFGTKRFISFEQFRDLTILLGDVGGGSVRDLVSQCWSELDPGLGGRISYFDLDPESAALLAKLRNRFLMMYGPSENLDEYALFNQMSCMITPKKPMQWDSYEFKSVMRPFCMTSAEVEKLMLLLDLYGGKQHPIAVRSADVMFLARLPELYNVDAALISPTTTKTSKAPQQTDWSSPGSPTAGFSPKSLQKSMTLALAMPAYADPVS